VSNCLTVIPAPWGADVMVKCGTTYATHYNYCKPCLERYEETYPQGWRYYAGDVCVHGTYTGGVGVDWMCGACEGGFTEKVLCEEPDCDAYEWGNYEERFRLYHAPNTEARNAVAKTVRELRTVVLKEGVSNGLHHPSVRKILWDWINRCPKESLHQTEVLN